jgi:hypothetical protein
MSGTYTPLRHLYKPAHAEVGWDAKVNANFDNLDNAADSSGGGGALIQARIPVSAAQLIAANVTPVALLPKPGAGKYYNVIALDVEYLFVTTPYTIAGGASLEWDNDDAFGGSTRFGGIVSCSGLLDQTSSTLAMHNAFDLTSGQTAQDISNWVNQGINLFINGGVSGGNGTLLILMSYTINTLG